MFNLFSIEFSSSVNEAFKVYFQFGDRSWTILAYLDDRKIIWNCWNPRNENWNQNRIIVKLTTLRIFIIKIRNAELDFFRPFFGKDQIKCDLAIICQHSSACCEWLLVFDFFFFSGLVQMGVSVYICSFEAEQKYWRMRHICCWFRRNACRCRTYEWRTQWLWIYQNYRI